MPNRNRITSDDIAPCICYWCFNEIEFNSQLILHNNFPYHRLCLRSTIKDKRRYDLINELLDYFQLYQSEMFIKGMLDEISDRVLNYNLKQTDRNIELYVWTESKLFILKHHFDNVKDDLHVELDHEQLSKLINLLH